MQLRDKGSDKTYHVPSPIGQKLVAAGLADEVISEVKAAQPVHKLKWVAKRGVRIEDYEPPPVVFWICEAWDASGKPFDCGEKGYTESHKGTAHQTVIRHCGGVETCPRDVAETYLRLFNEWKSKSKKADPKIISLLTNGFASASSPVAHIHAAGLKTTDELKDELKEEARLARLGLLVGR
jgi:hypothetical protein